MRKNMLVGEICAILSVIPLKLFNSSPVEAEVANVEVDVKEEWQPKADLEHLPTDQRKEIE